MSYTVVPILNRARVRAAGKSQRRTVALLNKECIFSVVPVASRNLARHQAVCRESIYTCSFEASPQDDNVRVLRMDGAVRTSRRIFSYPLLPQGRGYGIEA